MKTETYEERIRILRERYEEDDNERTIKIPEELKLKIILLTELLYRPHTEVQAPNYWFSVIETILTDNGR